MFNTEAVGLYGKLPSNGDFVHRRLPSNFINAWDTWLQSYMNTIREQLGDGWLDLYLTSPIWRFVFSPGVIDNKVWSGIMLPSVDRVGRYFPFTIAKSAPSTCNPFELIAQSSWFEALEKAALMALTGRCNVEQLSEDLDEPELVTDNAYVAASRVSESSAIVDLEEEARSISTGFPCLLDSLLRAKSASYSVWATQGSEHVEPCLFHCSGLPRLSGIAALLDGHWEQWGWPQPHRLLHSSVEVLG